MNSVDSILVTGATGSFGSVFVHFLLQATEVSRICVYSRGEHAQAALRDAIGNDSRVRYFIGDVRDVVRLTRACRGCDTVIHAAALKRIETGAYNPDEMVKTNVIGTMNVIEASIAAGVKRVIGLSSDKAYQPISPYGQSKALGESLLLSADELNGRRHTRFACTRYGNIWNAQGSVGPKWRERARLHQQLQVTDPDCTRFFMTINEAIHLVWDLALSMQGGELVIPDALPAYRLGDLAQVFGEHYGIDVVGLGLPAFEKLHESMRDGLCSRDARRMTLDELRGLV